MNFKEALIAHLRGEKVQVKKFDEWMAFEKWICDSVTLKDALADDFANACQFRIAPRMIVVNGVHVSAPETEAPKLGQRYFISDPTYEQGFSEVTWRNDIADNKYLRIGIVYLKKESARARANAMLITQEEVKP